MSCMFWDELKGAYDIQPKAVDERLRSLGGTKKLVVDVVKFPKGLSCTSTYPQLVLLI